MRIVLASASPRRAELLTLAGFEFDVDPAHIDETPRDSEEPADYALRIARAKALAVAARHPSRVVLAADTVVVLDEAIYGKPADRADAARMLRALSGRTHEVLTAIAIAGDPGSLRDDRKVHGAWPVAADGAPQMLEHLESTRVTFAPMTQAEIDWYVDSGEADDKAGAYAIQGLAARFIPRIEGSYSNVVGLPMAAIHRMLESGLTD